MAPSPYSARLIELVDSSGLSSFLFNKEWSSSPLLRALRDHWFTVRPQRAQRTIWPQLLLFVLFFPYWKGAHVGPTAPVERGPSQGARSGSTGRPWVAFRPPLALASQSWSPVEYVSAITHWLSDYFCLFVAGQKKDEIPREDRVFEG